MSIKNLREHLSNSSIDALEKEYNDVRTTPYNLKSDKLQDLIACFISTDEIEAVNNMSMLIAYLNIDIAPSLIIGKLLSGRYNNNGGTLLYSLLDLDYKGFESELKSLWRLPISYEMQNMLQLLQISEE